MLMEEFQDVGTECIQSVSWRCRCGYYTFHSWLYLFCSVLACSVTASTPFMYNVICHIFAWFAGRSVVYAVTVNYLYMDRVRVRVSIRVSIRVCGRITDRVRFRVMVRVRLQILQAMYCYGVNYTTPWFAYFQYILNYYTACDMGISLSNFLYVPFFVRSIVTVADGDGDFYMCIPHNILHQLM